MSNVANAQCSEDSQNRNHCPYLCFCSACHSASATNFTRCSTVAKCIQIFRAHTCVRVPVQLSGPDSRYGTESFMVVLHAYAVRYMEFFGDSNTTCCFGWLSFKGSSEAPHTPTGFRVHPRLLLILVVVKFFGRENCVSALALPNHRGPEKEEEEGSSIHSGVAP